MLIKHVLSSIPLHVFASLQSPKTVLRQLEQLFSSFFVANGVPKKVWRSWSRVCMPLQEKGLGVRSLADHLYILFL